ncbi:AbrB/MazE/SpoVT family DNA-binding domain-containing protein [Thiorhodococcus minor]|uniref:AbrB/MazE/SpoVT family DNA-binding domain-containing protein n=1 Tax=Thiorhodococcus minor TaxID=57489 RepID=A0A6M0K4J9_9GAMM|nr:AbrB/MazE/SpoVT family DNA-binding domain-containing protein [Thiorhodococcus minor]NEV64660.1 AbrB/MazE/SpoVT family DNA-binding domain-containing protein [Thiorhodococcus minor]
MAVATITSKGQITIPKEIRQELLLHSGDRIDFKLTEQGKVLLRPVTRRVDELFGRLHKHGQQALSPEDMDAAIRHRVTQSDA